MVKIEKEIQIDLAPKVMVQGTRIAKEPKMKMEILMEQSKGQGLASSKGES